MVETTVAYLLHQEPTWKSNPAFVKAVVDLTQKLSAATATATKYPAAVESARERAHDRELLEDLTSEIADQLFALSQETNDVALAAASDVSRSSLDLQSDQQLEHTAKHICELAMSHRDALARYLVVAADVAELATLTRNFSTWVQTPRATTKDFTTANETMEELVRAACRILRGRIDKLVTRYAASDPDFVRGYYGARIVLDRRGAQARGGAIEPHRVLTAKPEFAYI